MPDPKPQVKRMLWKEAVEIYACGVSERYAEFPINIEGRLRTELDKMFGNGVEVLREEMDGGEKASVEEDDPYSVVTPFANSPVEVPMKVMSPTTLAREMSNSSSFSPSSPSTKHDNVEIVDKESHNESTLTHSRDEEKCTVPEGFNEHVFDAAEKSIMYLVATNTWRKFVTAMRDGDPRISAETLA